MDKMNVESLVLIQSVGEEFCMSVENQYLKDMKGETSTNANWTFELSWLIDSPIDFENKIPNDCNLK